jgi:lipopolysaccharide heptosyltransferase II
MKILLIQLKRAGDVLLTTPVPAMLKKRFPDARIDFLVEKPFAPALENHPDIFRIQIYDRSHVIDSIRRIRAEHYDYIFDFLSSPRSALLVFLSGAARTFGWRVPFWGRFYGQAVSRPKGSKPVIGGKCTLVEPLLGLVPEWTERKLYLTEDERSWAEKAMPDAASAVGIIPTHRKESRRWRQDHFARLAVLLAQQGCKVWIFWGPGEKVVAEQIKKTVSAVDLIPEASLRQMAALLERCKFVVTNDNGPMHLAVAVGTPTVTIYGPTDPVCWNPGGPQHMAAQAQDVPCLGCNLNSCPFEHECMTHLTPDMVFNLTRQLIPRGVSG